jgi:hypothetical protein
VSPHLGTLIAKEPVRVVPRDSGDVSDPEDLLARECEEIKGMLTILIDAKRTAA